MARQGSEMEQVNRRLGVPRKGRKPRRAFTIAAVFAAPADAQACADALAQLTDRAPLAVVIAAYAEDAVFAERLRAVAPAIELVPAREGEPVEANRIYLLSRDRPLVVQDGRFAAPGQAGAGTPPFALLPSLAAQLGARAIAVLLSGSARASIESLAAIRARGGCVLVQDPATALFDEAPRAAIAMGLADLVLAPADIGRELLRLSRRSELRDRPGEAEALSDFDVVEGDDAALDEGFRRILSLLKTRFRADLGNYKLTTIRRRVQRRMSLRRFETMVAYADYLRAEPEALQELHDDLFIHVTQFFRDPESFEALRELVFPALIEDRSSEDRLRVWVPGCSTGEEAYSIAIALTEFLEAQQCPVRFQIFATDISDGAIQQARRAVYSPGLLHVLGPQRLERFFEPLEDGYKVRKELRDACIISRHDVTSNPPFAKLDLISCRNVLIYFGQSLQRRIVPVFHYALKPGGFLWLGRSETPGASSKRFDLVDKQNKIYTKVPSQAASLPLPVPGFTPDRLDLSRNLGREAKTELDVQRSADQWVLFKYGPPGVVIDTQLEILQFRGRTAPFLEAPPGQPTHSLPKMAHPDLLPVLRPLIESARKRNLAVRKERVAFEHGGMRRTIHLEVAPLNPLAPERERQFLVLFEDAGAVRAPAAERAERGAKLERRAAAADSKDRYIDQLHQEVEGLREYQQTLVEQFESAQEELTSANEELQATNEELQSTNEELETAKEELQSANEELTTMNDELQSRNAELVALNDKLARGEDRFRLMVEGVKDYAIYMLDRDGRVTSWNEGARRLKGYEASEILGQHYARFFLPEDVAARVPDAELERARIDGYFEDEGFRVRKDGSRFWANVVVTRITDRSGTLIGFSKVTRDLTEPKRAQEALERSEHRFKRMISNVRDYAIFMLDPECRVASWNEGARRLKGYSESEILGQHFSIFYPPEDVAAGKTEREIETVLAEGRCEDEGLRVRKDGSRFWANVIITRVDDSHGNLLGFTKVTRDLTEPRRAEEALRKANETLELRVRERTRELERALESRDAFLSIASHELKTPLTALKLRLQVARKNVQEGAVLSAEQAIVTFDKTLKQAVALEELVDDLLDISRIQSGRFALDLQPVDLSALLEDIAARFSDQLAHAQTGIELRLTPGVLGRWDARRIAQVVVNLISNAIKYAPKSAIHVSTVRRGDWVEIAVRDFGPGIGPEKQATIFERFERAGASPNVGGLGLGLFIARRIVEAHQGAIRVESRLGEGARFVVELPLAPSPEELRPVLGEEDG